MKSLIKIAGALMMLVFSAGLSMVSAQKHHHKHGKGHYKKVAYCHARPTREVVYYREPVRHRYYRPVVHHPEPVSVYVAPPRPPRVAIVINP